MKTVIFPRTDGDLILDFREVLSDGVIRSALVAVDAKGTVRGKVVEVRDGGGHVELHRFSVDPTIGFELNTNQRVLIYPEGV